MKAAARGVHVTVIIDACHSGGQARGAMDGMVKRSLSWDPRDLNQPVLVGADGSPAKGPEDLDDNPVLVLAASQKDQSALDVQDSTCLLYTSFLGCSCPSSYHRGRDVVLSPFVQTAVGARRGDPSNRESDRRQKAARRVWRSRTGREISVSYTHLDVYKRQQQEP